MALAQTREKDYIGSAIIDSFLAGGSSSSSSSNDDYSECFRRVQVHENY